MMGNNVGGCWVDAGRRASVVGLTEDPFVCIGVSWTTGEPIRRALRAAWRIDRGRSRCMRISVGKA